MLATSHNIHYLICVVIIEDNENYGLKLFSLSLFLLLDDHIYLNDNKFNLVALSKRCECK